jgi:hypothetical protein
MLRQLNKGRRNKEACDISFKHHHRTDDLDVDGRIMLSCMDWIPLNHETV